jgi:alkylhydroperoxidase/carboxymuconolactone decarboxylase family protein YurZ
MHCAPVHAAGPGAMFDGIHAASKTFTNILNQNSTAAMSVDSTAKIVRVQFKLTTDNSMDGSIFSDGTMACSVLHLISIANKATYDDHAHAKQVWRKFKKHPIYADELARLSRYGNDYRINPVMSVVDLKRLLTILPDTRRMDRMTQTKHRETLGATLTRFIGGDKSMVLFPALKLDARLALTLSNIEASAEIVSEAATRSRLYAVSSVKINATAVIEAEIEDTCAVSKFFSDINNKTFTSSDGNAWWFVCAFKPVLFEGSFDSVSRTWSRLLQGPFKDEIKYPNLNDGIQKVWDFRRSMLQNAQCPKESVSAGASIAASHDQVLGMCA